MLTSHKSFFQEQTLRILAESNAVKTDGHFVYTSGRHGSVYVDKTAITPNVRQFQQLCHLIAVQATHNVKPPDVVIGAVVVGERMTHPVALCIGREYHTYPISIWADKKENDLVIGRCFNRYLRGKRVLVVEDVVNTGGTVKRVVELVRACGGMVTTVAAICNRGPTTSADFGDGVNFFALANVAAESFAPDDCPLCREGVPIDTKLDHGKTFLAKRR